MVHAGVGTRPVEDGGTQPGEAVRCWPRAAVALAAAALIGCSALQGLVPAGSDAELERRIAAGRRLYDDAEYMLAARRFQEASRYAHDRRLVEREKQSTIAECTAWLRARAITELDTCSRRLDRLHRRANRSERGIGALLALGAIAGDRPLPRFRIPSDVVPLIRAAAAEGGDTR